MYTNGQLRCVQMLDALLDDKQVGDSVSSTRDGCGVHVCVWCNVDVLLPMLDALLDAKQVSVFVVGKKRDSVYANSKMTYFHSRMLASMFCQLS